MASSSARRRSAAATAPVHPPDRDRLLEFYRRMFLIRTVELRLADQFAAGAVPGFIHLSVGQEAVAAGLSVALRPGDTFATTHRGHGHAIANRVDLTRFLAEILGREGGLCRGRGGSMHVADLSIGMLGANGIVGAGIPIAAGSALAHQIRGEQALAVATFGDGALAEGALHETLNITRLWNLPVLFVCENNGWSEFSPTSQQFAAALGDLAKAFHIAFQQVDGNDPVAVADAAMTGATACREGRGPFILECTTHRHRGHFEGDPQRYREEAEVTALADHDPVTRGRRDLLAAGMAAAAIDGLEEEVIREVSMALIEAHASPAPVLADALRDVFRGEFHA